MFILYKAAQLNRKFKKYDAISADKHSHDISKNSE